MDSSRETSRGTRYARRVASAILLFLAVTMLAVGAITGWLRTQVMDTDQWVETSREVLQQPEVQEAVSTWTVDQVFDRLEPEDLLGDLLPPRLAPLAGPVTSRMRTEAYEIAGKAVADPRVEDAWANANRRAHERFVNIVHGTDPILVETNGGLVLDLRPFLELIAEKIGVGEKLIDKIPQRITTVEPQRSDQVERVLEALRVLDNWGAWLSLLTLPLFAAGIWLANDRRRTWMWTGAGIVVASWLITQAREYLGPETADLLTTATTWRMAILETWDAVTLKLADIGSAGIVIGFGIMAMAFVTGPSRPMKAVRAFAAPVLVPYPRVTIAVGVVLGWLVVHGVDLLADRRPWARLVMIIGFGVVAWSLARSAKAEAELAAAQDADADAARETTTTTDDDTVTA